MTQRFIHFHNLHVVTERKKDSIKVESTALAWLRDTTYFEEKERADTDLEFHSVFSVVDLTCLLAGFVFTGSFLVRETSSQIPSAKMGLVNFRLSIHLHG